MAVNLKIRNKLPYGSVVFDNVAYDNSIIGVTFNGRAIYDLHCMIDEYMQDNNCSYDEAIEWIEYNTLRALPYINGNMPLVVADISKDY